MRIIGQCSEAEARGLFAAPHGKTDVWVSCSEGGCPGMVSYSVVGYTADRHVRRLFTVEERFVDDKGSRDCVDKVCLHAVGKYLARYGCRFGAPSADFGDARNFEVERVWGAGRGRRVGIVGGGPYAGGGAYYA